jgi:hypothetical protein
MPMTNGHLQATRAWDGGGIALIHFRVAVPCLV